MPYQILAHQAQEVRELVKVEVGSLNSARININLTVIKLCKVTSGFEIPEPKE